MLGEIIGWELLVVIAVVALLFGSTQIPKVARSIGEASRELRKGIAEGDRSDADRQPGPGDDTDEQGVAGR